MASTREVQFNGARLVIGWREMVSFPEWGVMDLPAKNDTGAKTTAMDVANIEKLTGNRVRFDVVLHRTRRHLRKTVTAHIVRTTRVRSSNGHTEERYLVETLMQLGPISKRIEVSLVSRRNMLSRTLIGRSALQEDFLVDARHKYLIRKRTPTRKASPKKPR